MLPISYLKYPEMCRCGIETGEAGFGGVHLVEAVGGKSEPGFWQSAASGRLKASTKNPFLWDAAC